MTIDIVEKLQAQQVAIAQGERHPYPSLGLLRDATDEIARLRTAQPVDHDGIVKAARELIEQHDKFLSGDGTAGKWIESVNALRRALASEPTVDRDRKLTPEEREHLINLCPIHPIEPLFKFVESLLNPINQRNERDAARWRKWCEITAPMLNIAMVTAQIDAHIAESPTTAKIAAKEDRK